MVTQDEFLSAGIAAAKAGDLARAREFFAKAVQANPRSEDAWLQLGLVLQEQDRREYCFRQVLALNPHNEQAQQQLAGAVDKSIDKPSKPTPSPSSPAQDERITPRLSDREPSQESRDLAARDPEQAKRPRENPVTRPASSPGQLGRIPLPAPAWATESPDKELGAHAQASASFTETEPVPRTVAPAAPVHVSIPVDSQIPAAGAASKPDSEEPAGRAERMLIALLGVVVGLLLCGGPILFVVQTGRVDPLLPVALVPPFVPTATPTVPTATPTLTPTPLPSTPTPSSTPTFTKQEKADAASADYERAEAFMDQKDFAQAIPMWNRVIGSGTDNSKPYIRRAIAYLALVSNQRTMSESVDYLHKVLADTDKAIGLAPAMGDYYVIRFMAYYDLAGTEYFRVDRDRLYELALENLKVALALGSTQTTSELDVASLDLLLGRCDESIDIVNRLLAAAGMTNTPNADTATLLSRGYLCKGKFDEALRYIDLAIKLNPACCGGWVRAIILTNMGRLDDALTELNKMTEASPYYGGTRYYLRALIYYDLKKPDLAQKDLITGSAQTWSRYELRSYVQGRMALDAGDKKTGIEQLLLAEATLTRDYGPLIDRIRRELKQLNAAPLSPTLSIPFKSTPIAIPKVTATLSSKSAAQTPAADPKGAVPINLETGTGYFTLQPNGYPLYRFQPSSPLQFKTVQSLTFKITLPGAGVSAPFQLYLRDTGRGEWGYFEIKWGDNPITNPQRYVSPQGEITAALRNTSMQMFGIQNAGFTLVVQQADGKTVAYGLK